MPEHGPTPVVRYLTIPEVAHLLTVTPRHVYRLIHEGELTPVNVASDPNGRGLQRIGEDEVGRFLASRKLAAS